MVANAGAYEGFLAFWQTEVGVFFGSMEAEMSLAHIINDIFMAVFFLLVGLEIKYEMTVGELTNIRQALLPIVAACGGVVAPILIYLAFNGGNPDTSHGWGVPTATDIAFALGIMALLGNRVPNGVRVFLSTLAVADDIIAILVIAIFYGHSPSLFWLGCAAGVFVVLLIMNRSHLLAGAVPLGRRRAVVLRVHVGRHSTIAGVLLAFAIPTGSRVNLKSFISWSGGKVREARDAFDDATPVMGQQDYLKTVQSLSNVARQVVPPHASGAQAVPVGCTSASCRCSLSRTPTSASSAAIGGHVLQPGALRGVLRPFGGQARGHHAVQLHRGEAEGGLAAPERQLDTLLGAAILGGVGFTMAIFVANLAFADEQLVTAAKLGILSASLLAGVL